MKRIEITETYQSSLILSAESWQYTLGEIVETY